MNNTSYVALSRQTALERMMTVIANNVANSASTGFKAERVRFDTVLEDAGAAGDIAFVQDVGARIDLRDGPIEATGNPLDLAIQGDGFFVVGTAAGDRYTSAGQFRLNDIGEIVTASGDPVMTIDDVSVLIPAETKNITVAADGTVTADEVFVGQLAKVRFAEPDSLVRVGDTLFASDALPEPAADSEIQQGMIEGSNVQAVLEITQMMQTVRSFQSTQKVIETQHDLTRRAVERILDVSS
ncbi:MAG: flagellar basal-body rod protein FlgF [Geminicoccaceae bacterium]